MSHLYQKFDYIQWGKLYQYLFFFGERGVHKLAVQHTGALGVRGQQPDNKGNLQLKIKRKPGKLEVNI